MDDYSQHDIREASFEEFVSFLFDQEVIPDPRDPTVGPCPWYYRANVEYNPHRVADDYIRLFKAPKFLLSPFSADQLEQGFWAIQSCLLDCSIATVIWDETVPFEVRASCVRIDVQSFRAAFRDRAARHVVAYVVGFTRIRLALRNRARANGGEDERMQDVMFDTLAKILELASSSCQMAALHGLGHLHHPGTADNL